MLMPLPTVAAGDFADTGAAAAFRQGDYPLALQELGRLLDASPDDQTVKRYLAITLGRLGRYQEAIEVFHDMLRQQPGSASTRYHAAATYYEAGLGDAAEPLFREVLALAPDTRYSELAREYLDAIALQRSQVQRRGTARRLGLYAQVAVERDDNVGLLSEDSGLFANQQIATRLAEYLSLDWNLLRNERWNVNAEVSAYAAQYQQDEFQRFEMDQVGAAVRVQRVFGEDRRATTVSMRYDYSSSRLDGEDYAESHRGYLGVRSRFSDNSSSSIYYEFTRDAFDEEPFKPEIASRDADNHVLGISHSIFFLDRGGELRFTGEVEDNRADGLNYDYSGYRGEIDLRLPVTAGLVLRTGAAFWEREYENFVGPVMRETETVEYSLAVQRWFGKHVLGRVQARHRQEESSYDVLSYERTRWGLDVSYVY